MNRIGETAGGTKIIAMSQAEGDLFRKIADGMKELPSGLIVIEMSDKQFDQLAGMVASVKARRK